MERPRRVPDHPRSRRRGAPRAGRRGAGTGGARRSARGGRCGATVPRDRSRCSRRSGGPSRAEPAGRASSRAASPATRAPPGGPPGRVRRRHRCAGASRLDRRTQGGHHDPYAIVRPNMQTSLARRQRHRRAGARRRPRGSSAVRRTAIAIPILLFATLPRRGPGGLPRGVGRLQLLQPGPSRPEGRCSTDLDFDQQTVVYDRTGTIELARLGERKRELVTFDELPPEVLDATTAIEDKDFWGNPGLRPRRLPVGHGRHPQRPAPWRFDDHPAARPGATPAAERLRGQPRGAQDPGDHPVAFA